MESNSILPGSGKIYSLQRGFVISRLFSIYFTITGAKNIVCYIEDFIVYSCFEKGCRIKCTDNPWVVLSSLFFKEIWENGTRETVDICLRVLKESNKSNWSCTFFPTTFLERFVLSRFHCTDCSTQNTKHLRTAQHKSPSVKTKSNQYLQHVPRKLHFVRQ